MAEPVIVLAGGLGTRLRTAVPDVPKVLVPAGGRPFLAWLLAGLARQGARRCILSLGHRAEQVLAYLDSARDQLPAGLSLETVVEPSPLGTGGAVRHVVERLGLTGPVIAANGDTYLPDGLRELRAGSGTPEHLIGLVQVADTARYGRVETQDGRVTRFDEKGVSGPGSIYAGICRLPGEAFLRCAAPFSLERDLLAPLAQAGRLHGRDLRSRFIDIGIPEDYKTFCAWAESGAVA